MIISPFDIAKMGLGRPKFHMNVMLMLMKNVRVESICRRQDNYGVK